MFSNIIVEYYCAYCKLAIPSENCILAASLFFILCNVNSLFDYVIFLYNTYSYLHLTLK